MNDDKKNAAGEFDAFLKGKIDDMFSRDLSAEEVNQVIMQETTEALDQATLVNDIASEVIIDSEAVLSALTTAEKKVEDLNKLIQVREDLDIAA